MYMYGFAENLHCHVHADPHIPNLHKGDQDWEVNRGLIMTRESSRAGLAYYNKLITKQLTNGNTVALKLIEFRFDLPWTQQFKQTSSYTETACNDVPHPRQPPAAGRCPRCRFAALKFRGVDEHYVRSLSKKCRSGKHLLHKRSHLIKFKIPNRVHSLHHELLQNLIQIRQHNQV